MALYLLRFAVCGALCNDLVIILANSMMLRWLSGTCICYFSVFLLQNVQLQNVQWQNNKVMTCWICKSVSSLLWKVLLRGGLNQFLHMQVSFRYLLSHSNHVICWQNCAGIHVHRELILSTLVIPWLLLWCHHDLWFIILNALFYLASGAPSITDIQIVFHHESFC